MVRGRAPTFPSQVLDMGKWAREASGRLATKGSACDRGWMHRASIPTCEGGGAAQRGTGPVTNARSSAQAGQGMGTHTY